MKKIGVILLTILSLSSCQDAPELILFSSGRTGNSDIYLMYADGSNTQRLTTSLFEEWAPVWVHAGKISFLRQKYERIVRVTLDLENGEEKEIDHPAGCLLDDKNSLYDEINDRQIYICDENILVQEANGAIKNLTQKLDGIANYPAIGVPPNQVLFTSNHTGYNDLYIAETNSAKLINLTSSDSNDERGDISPDGEWVVYSSDRFEASNQDLVLLNLKTKKLERLTNNPNNELIARWSKDNETIYYGAHTGDNWEIYSMNVFLKQSTRPTYTPGFDGDPRIWRGW